MSRLKTYNTMNTIKQNKGIVASSSVPAAFSISVLLHRRPFPLLKPAVLTDRLRLSKLPPHASIGLQKTFATVALKTGATTTAWSNTASKSRPKLPATLDSDQCPNPSSRTTPTFTPVSHKPSLPVFKSTAKTTTAPSPTSSAPRSKNTFSLVVMTLLLSSLGFMAGYEHGAHAGYEAAVMAAEQETGHRGPERSRSITGGLTNLWLRRANGLGTGP